MDLMEQKQVLQPEKPCSNATRVCFKKFETCIAALNGEYQDYLEVRFADLKLWAGSVGALAAGQASLDSKLSGRSTEIFVVINLLRLLEQFIEYYTISARGSSDDSEMQQAAQGIEGTTSNLVWIGWAIRGSGTTSRLQTADMSFESDRRKDKIEYDQLRVHLICIMTSRPNEDAKSDDFVHDFQTKDLSRIQKRLIKANLRRFHRFRYAQSHSNELKASQFDQSIAVNLMPEKDAPGSLAESTNSTISQTKASAAENNTDPVKQQGEACDLNHIDDTVCQAASAMDSECLGLDFQRIRQAKSMATRISTIAGRITFPKAKIPQEQRKTLLCPCCCQTIPLEEAKDIDLWIKHMRNDIKPYTCIVENCPTPYKLYATQKEWSEHVRSDHPPKWRCSCCPTPRPVFHSLQAFICHLGDMHEEDVCDGDMYEKDVCDGDMHENDVYNGDKYEKDVYDGDIHERGGCDDKFQDVFARSAFHPLGIEHCPLCKEEGPTDSPELIEHVLGHVHDFSMYALPWRTRPQPNLNRPVLTFNDALAIEPHKGKDATMHARLREWVEEHQVGDAELTVKCKRWIHDLIEEDGNKEEEKAEATAFDYFDGAGIDYFKDDSNSWKALSTRRLSSSPSHPPSDYSIDSSSSRHPASYHAIDPDISYMGGLGGMEEDTRAEVGATVRYFPSIALDDIEENTRAGMRTPATVSSLGSKVGSCSSMSQEPQDHEAGLDELQPLEADNTELWTAVNTAAQSRSQLPMLSSAAVAADDPILAGFGSESANSEETSWTGF